MRFFPLLMLLLSFQAFSQGFQLGLSTAYSVSAPNSFAGQDEKDMFVDELSVSNMRGNFGSGPNYLLECDLRLKNKIKVGIDFSYFKSNELVLKSYNRDSISQLITSRTQQMRMMPHVTLSVPLTKLTFEAEAGVIMPLKSYSDFHVLESNSSSGLTRKSSQHYTYNFSFGFYQAIGFEKKFGTGFLLKSQLGINLFAQTTRYKTTTSYLVNDADQKSQLSLYEQETQYFPNLNNFSNNADYNPDYVTAKAKDELAVSHSFSSLFFGISLAYEFNKTK
ncbi:MAG: hypothetical protein ACO1O6_15450 [Bacteroidota bacterium]